MITIIDYGLGNVGSVANMFNKLGARATIASRGGAVETPEALVLPGVGHFDAGMRLLDERGFIAPLTELVSKRNVPILGICLGMQLFTRGSEEGSLPGLGWIAADTKRFQFPPTDRRVVPHMGWSTTVGRDPDLFGGFESPPRFYFVHSYHVVCDDPHDVAATCRYGIEFTAAIRRRNVFGTQFHPEKSHRFGMTLLRSFLSSIRKR